ncbi:MAG TPA: DUF3597 domain-containing protein [Xanthobacteraceae bacterium]|jgi:hypothetical protein
MSIFGNIMSAIFGHGGQNPTASTGGPAAATGSSAAPTSKPTNTAAAGPAGQAQPTSGASNVDVEAVLTRLAAQKKEKLDWRRSIVDLMKVLDLDSSFAARKQLAQELHYTGDTGDSAAMNIWLHKQVMIKLAENGGKVPAELRH